MSLPNTVTVSTVPATPTAERSLARQAVLDEDEYTAALSHIIARDFFPALLHSDVAKTDANGFPLTTRTPHPAASTSAYASASASSGATAATPLGTATWGWGDTPYVRDSTELEGDASTTGHDERPQPRYDAGLRLDEFQARYTSEDNASFAQILDEENRKRKERWAWAWDAQKRVEGQQRRVEAARARMLIEAPPLVGVKERFVIEQPVRGLIEVGGDDGGSGQVIVMEEDDRKVKDEQGKGKEVVEGKGEEVAIVEEAPVDVMAPRKDTRSAGVDGWNFKTRNSFMFPPDSDISPYQQKSKLSDPSNDLKTINYGSTRMSDGHLAQISSRGASAPPSPTRSKIEAAITGHSYHPRSPSHHSLIPTIPSPTASELGPAAVKQLMTWGTLTGTPRIISQSEDVSLPLANTPFHIVAPSAREAVSHRLSNKASRSLRAKAGMLGLGSIGRTPGITQGHGRTRGSMGPPPGTPRRSEAAGNLTPAAKRLLERSTMGTMAARRAEAMERASGWEGAAGGRERELNRVRWTPTPSSATRG